MIEKDASHTRILGIHDLPTVQELVEERLMKGSIELLKQVADTLGYSLVEKPSARN